MHIRIARPLDITFKPTLRALAAALLSGFAVAGAQAADANFVPVTGLTPQCAGPYTFANAVCEGNAEKLKALDTQTKCEAAPGTAWDSKASKPACLADLPNRPLATCGDQVPGLVIKEGACAYDRSVPRAAAGNYKGDCLRIVLAPGGRVNEFPKDQDYQVIAQKPLGDDQELTLVTAESLWPGKLHPYFGGCPSTSNLGVKVRASDLVDAGAKRVGWTYGLLTLPFKYYKGQKAFSSGFTLGPYVGRRFSVAESAITVAAGAAFGSVKGEVVDADDKTTSTPELMSFSSAVGVMWDISKNTAAKPFKIGLFIGKDRVSAGESVKYKFDRQTWYAFQIGYDFTDN